jgi:DNA polymerase (family X)
MNRSEINESIASKLRQMADVLEQQNADGFRVSAYRRAAETVEGLEEPVSDLIRDGGRLALVALPAIGRGIAAAIDEMVSTGRWGQLERLAGTLQPEQLFQTIPGIGPQMAGRIHDELEVDTLEALEAAAHDGRLEEVPGIGPRRAAAIRASLGQRLGRRHIRISAPPAAPPVAVLLSADHEYRTKASAGELRKIAPKRFNPSGEVWLPVLHTKRGNWDLTLLFSNTQKAHELGKTGDWVVIYFHDENGPEGQCTVVTETRGPLAGRRVVRGREGDCIAHYGDAQGM